MVKNTRYNFNNSEVNIIKCIALGLSNKEICKKLYLSENTVKKYMHNILVKLNLRDRTQLAIFAIKNGIDK